MKSLQERVMSFRENEMLRNIVFLVISAVGVILSLAGVRWGMVDPAWIAIIFCGIPIVKEAVIGLVTAFDIKADVLVSLALVASVCIGEIFAAGEVALIMQLGSLLEELTVAKARAGIEKLVQLTPQTARRLVDGREEIIKAEEVALDDVLRVLPGETVPVDGVILSGTTSINQAVMTGESLPVDKTVGDDVFSGTVNQFGAFEMKATRVGEDSSLQRMVRLVESADAGKAKIVGLADRWATWIVVIALTAAVLTWAVTGEIIRAVTILVVFCPCSLVLATPTAIMAGIGNATKHGFLVREGDALERLASVQYVTFDKTGTLTHGTPEVVAVKSIHADWNEERLYAYSAAAEQLSEHPLGKAIVSDYRKVYKQSLKSVQHFKLLRGNGIQAEVESSVLLLGKAAFLKCEGVEIPENVLQETQKDLEKGCTVIFAAADRVCIGYLVLADTIREDSKAAISGLKQQRVEPVLLTGDNAFAAKEIAGQAGITQFQAECMPEDKLEWISDTQKKGGHVCMIGDGINDAPALKMADVGIAMGGIGSDIAVDAADIVLVNDKLGELKHLFAMAKKMMRTIKINLTFSMLLNFVAIILAITGILHPVVGALVHNAGSVLVIINSLFVLYFTSEKPESSCADDSVKEDPAFS